MNKRCNLAKIIFLLVLVWLLFLNFQVVNCSQDTLKTQIFTDINCDWFPHDSLIVINDEESLDKLVKSSRCDSISEFNIDFGQYSLIALNIFADCAATFKTIVLKNEAEKVIHIIINEYYGGCAGMYVFGNFILLEKIPPDYHLTKEIIKEN